MLKRREQRWGKIDGTSPPQSQLDFIKQTGASEVGGEFQLWRVSPRIRHYQSPLSLHEPGQALVLLKLARPGSSAPTGPNTLILILSERRIERGRHSTHISCTSCKPHMLHVTSLWFNGLQKEMKRETKRAAAVICLVYVNRLELGSYYSSPTSHTRTEAQWSNQGLKWSYAHTQTQTLVSRVSSKQFMQNMRPYVW